jgi:hypothetical protein
MTDIANAELSVDERLAIDAIAAREIEDLGQASDLQAIEGAGERLARYARIRRDTDDILSGVMPLEGRIEELRAEWSHDLEELRADGSDKESRARRLHGCDELLARIDWYRTSCDVCGKHPTAWVYIDDPDPRRGVCDICVAKIRAEDSGVVDYAARALAHAAAAMHHEIADADEVRRFVGLLLDMALADDYAGEIDVPVFTMAPKFRPLEQLEAAAA